MYGYKKKRFGYRPRRRWSQSPRTRFKKRYYKPRRRW